MKRYFVLENRIRRLEKAILENKDLVILNNLVYEGKRDFDLLRSYLGDDLYEAYMNIRSKIPSDADLNRQYPEFTEDDIVKNEKSFIKKYSNVRNSNIVSKFGGDLFSKYPKSISSEDLHNNIEQCISDYDDIVNFVKQSFHNFRSFEELKKMNVNDIRTFVNSYTSVRVSKDSDKTHGATKLYEDSNWVVYHITDYNAAKYYGRDTKWCLAGNYDGLEEVGWHEFEKYNSKSNIYFYINKHKAREKYAILKNRYTDRITDVYDSSDHNLGNSAYYIDVDLPYVKEIGFNTVEQEDLLFAIKDDDLEMVKQCVNENTINAVTPTGRTPLMIAAARDGADVIEIVEYLIDNGADVSYVSKDGKSALVIASESGNYEMVKLLVEYGHADVNNPMTEYVSAAYLGTDDEDIKEYLISKGAKID